MLLRFQMATLAVTDGTEQRCSLPSDASQVDHVGMRWMLLVAAVVSGCGASMVNAPGAGGSAFAPVNEGSRPGVVSYLNQGASFVVKARREDAYKQMFAACHGVYRIDGEGPHESGGVVTSAGNSAYVTAVQYWYIQFSCVPPVAKN